MPAAISVSALSVDRGGRRVLDGLSVAFEAGRVTGLLGPSGCGKTTLMRSIVGVQVTDSGTIEVLGLPAGDRRLRHRMGYMTQAPSVYTDLSVEENLQYFAGVLDAGRDAVTRTLDEVGLTGRGGQVVGRLSGGERARVSLAVALLNHPEVLVLDEPTVGLDPVLRTQLWSLFHRLADEGVTLIVSSHSMEEASRCDLLVLMRDGRILATGSEADLRSSAHAGSIEDAFLRLVSQADPP